MAKLRAAESEAETATAERNELLLALEEHKGPWMDEVCWSCWLFHNDRSIYSNHMLPVSLKLLHP